MISAENFLDSRERARSLLSPNQAMESYENWGKVSENWSQYNSPKDLLPCLTHDTMDDAKGFDEIIKSIGSLSSEELLWAQEYAKIYDHVCTLISSSLQSIDFRYGIAKTLLDWQMIRNYVESPNSILDLNVGCGSNSVATYLFKHPVKYTAVETCLAEYIVQNVVLSYLSTLEANDRFYDLLDFEKSNTPFPISEELEPEGERFHVPTWLAESYLSANSYDVIIAPNIPIGTSNHDFMRLIKIIEKSLSSNGIVYMRHKESSEYVEKFVETVDLDNSSLFSKMRECKIMPIHCEFISSGYLTTVFARIGSNIYESVKASKKIEQQFLETKCYRDILLKVAQNFPNINKNKVTEADPVFSSIISHSRDINVSSDRK
jgi:hypothetical protein